MYCVGQYFVFGAIFLEIGVIPFIAPGLPIMLGVGGFLNFYLLSSIVRKLETAYNVVAKMEGAEFPDQWVMRGNHHDAWNHGAADPVSGVAAMLAEAKAIAALPQRPARTVVYAAWDAEEPGLFGSTEWAEENARELSRKAVAYINTDGNGRGFLRMALGGVALGAVAPALGYTTLARFDSDSKRDAFDGARQVLARLQETPPKLT